jgi:UDP-N-acetylmuramyl tripeptide synthase
MQRVDARRLTGPSHLAWVPLVLVEVSLAESETADRAAATYAQELARMRAALGLRAEVEMVVRPHAGGAVFGYPGPIDALLTLTEVSEWAVDSAAAVLSGMSAWPLEPRRSELAAQLKQDLKPALIALSEEARRRGVAVLWDDRETSVGLGCRSVVYANADIPPVTEVPWERVGTIPVAMVTGTNGKTTSARLLARVVREAGLIVGQSSTDGVVVGTETLEEGDWTGPAAARRVLRHPEVQLAVLETARGGILRRGLAVDSCDAALITNVSADHVGGYGIDDVPAMTQVKGVVARAVRREGTVVLNARDPNLVGFAAGLEVPVTFFADLDAGPTTVNLAGAQVVGRHRAAGGRVVLARRGQVLVAEGDGDGSEREIIGLDEVPLTFGGAARYNVENVLGVVAMAGALGLPDAAVVAALRGFDMQDNPGRGQLVVKDGVRVLLDFGHNPEGVRAVLRLVASMLRESPGRLILITGHAGDRSDGDIAEVGQAIMEAQPARVLVRELPGYERGRAPGEVPAVFRRVLLELGLPAAAFTVAENEAAALKEALREAVPGDVVALLVHLEREAVAEVLRG